MVAVGGVIENGEDFPFAGEDFVEGVALGDDEGLQDAAVGVFDLDGAGAIGFIFIGLDGETEEIGGQGSALRVLDGLNPRVGGRGRDGEVGGDLDVQVATTTGDLDGVVRSVFHDENREGDGGHDGFLLAVGDEDEHLVVGDGGWSRDADGAGEVIFFDDLGFPAVGGDGFHEGGIVAL